MKVVVFRDAAELAAAAAILFRERLTARPDLAMAVPAGRTPRRMYARLRDWQAREPVDYGRMRVFSIDELCPPAPADGYFWRQVRSEFLSWAGVPTERCHPFDVGAPDLEAMSGRSVARARSSCSSAAPPSARRSHGSSTAPSIRRCRPQRSACTLGARFSRTRRLTRER